MTKPFFIKLNRADNTYTPADPEVSGWCITGRYGNGPRDAIKRTQFSIINEQFPDKFHWDESNDDYRREIFDEIELNTKNLVNQGFEYNGKIFANNVDSRGQYTALYAAREDPFFLPQYPIEFATLDDLDMISLLNPEQAREFCLTAAGNFLAIKKTGTALKKAVKDLPASQLGKWHDSRVPVTAQQQELIDQAIAAEEAANNPPPEDPPPEEPPAEPETPPEETPTEPEETPEEPEEPPVEGGGEETPPTEEPPTNEPPTGGGEETPQEPSPEEEPDTP